MEELPEKKQWVLLGLIQQSQARFIKKEKKKKNTHKQLPINDSK